MRNKTPANVTLAEIPQKNRQTTQTQPKSLVTYADQAGPRVCVWSRLFLAIRHGLSPSFVASSGWLSRFLALFLSPDSGLHHSSPGRRQCRSAGPAVL